SFASSYVSDDLTGTSATYSSRHGSHEALVSPVVYGLYYPVTSRSHRRARSCSRLVSFRHIRHKDRRKTTPFSTVTRKKLVDAVNEPCSHRFAAGRIRPVCGPVAG